MSFLTTVFAEQLTVTVSPPPTVDITPHLVLRALVNVGILSIPIHTSMPSRRFTQQSLLRKETHKKVVKYIN